jgi:hypothetical protein
VGRRRKTKPLYYIEQPNMEGITPSMQKTYHLKVQEGEDIKDKNVDLSPSQEEEDIIVDDKVISPANETAVAEQKELVSTQSEDGSRRKPFSALSVHEKIQYLKEFPVSVIKIYYSFVTTEGKIIGYFVSSGENTITILPRNKRKPIEIAADEIKDIKVYGL